MFGPTMCCTTTAKEKDVVEKVDYKYDEREIGVSIYMDDIAVAVEDDRRLKKEKKCAKMKVKKKKKYNLSKTKYMVVKTGKEKEEDIFKEHSTNQEIRILRNHNK